MNPQLHENNYFVVEEFLHPEAALEMGKQFRKDCIEKYIKSDDTVPGAPAVYGYPLFYKLLFSKIFYMNDQVGEKLYPTYCYARWYKTGAELKPHVDAGPCEVSVSLNLMGDTWPINFTKPDGSTVSVSLSPGDAVIYRGTKSCHWRDTFDGKECLQVFLHYVRTEGPNYLHAFDLQRQGMI
jgi:hypothetical protein